jgi:HB1, ASXL, restriction endonuclease HTH domain
LDAYLEIAAKILRVERRPMSPQAILAAAYRKALVPPRLHGRTQHKTLQARISEDIIERREHSAFFRTSPGRFFLREFLTDDRIPEEFRRPFPARRRFRELMNGPALAISRAVLRSVGDENTPIEPQKIYDLLHAGLFSYDNPKHKSGDVAFFRSFVCVHRDHDVLSYRIGRYRDDRDNFMSRRSIGFSAFVHADEHTLFNVGDLGIVDSGVRATKIDLDIPQVVNEQFEASLRYFLWRISEEGATELLAIIKFECPKWFEPLKRRLALNDLAWLDISKPVNDIDDFDPWSKLVLLTYYRAHAGTSNAFVSYTESIEPTERRLSEVSNRDR